MATESSKLPVADYHMHTPLCQHAEGWPVDYARVAVERGLAEIGFSDHNPMGGQFDNWRMNDADFPRYLEEVARARGEFSNDLDIRLGLECDFIPGGEKWVEQLGDRADFDYLIGSVHYLEPGWAVDDPDPKWAAKWEGAVEEIWTRYWDLYRQCAASGLFDFLGHPDLVKKFGHRPGGDLKRFYEPTIEVIAANGVAIELSTAGLRKPCVEMYPAVEFLRLACQADIPIVISSDAHRPDEVGADFPAAIEIARGAGYTHTARFERRTRTLVPLGSRQMEV
jgi:histidinol-phosphatase (PHP family)